MPSPGGYAWQGAAADAAVERARTDQVKVQTLAQDLRSAAATASGAAKEVALAKKPALQAIGEAHGQGFVVGEDLSVSDQQTPVSSEEQALRQVQAEALAAEIRDKAATLAAADTDGAAGISAAVASLAAATFPENDGDENRVIQAVDFKQTPETDDPSGPAGDDVQRHPDHPDHRPDGRWAPGNSGVDGDSAAQKTFDDMESLGIPLVRQEVTVHVTDPDTGQTFTRRYDALQPTGVPGQYTGIEHKVNQSPITPNQRTVDDLVASGVPAQGTLDGQPIEVVDVDVIRVEWPPPEGAVPDTSTGRPVGEAIPSKIIESAPKGVPDWGTQVSPDELRVTDGPMGILQDFRDAFVPRDPDNPDTQA